MKHVLQRKEFKLRKGVGSPTLEDILVYYQHWVNDTRDNSFEIEPIRDTARMALLRDDSRVRYGILDDADGVSYLLTHWKQEFKGIILDVFFNASCSNTGTINCSIQMNAFVPKGVHVPARTTPRIIQELSEEYNIFDKGRLCSSEIELYDRDKTEAYIKYTLLDSNQTPQFVFTTDESGESNWKKHYRWYLLNIATPVMLDSSATYALTNEFGKNLSVYNKCARLYYPSSERQFRSTYHPLAIETSYFTFEKSFNRIVSEATRRAIANSTSQEVLVPREVISRFRSECEKSIFSMLSDANKKDVQILEDENARLHNENEELYNDLELLESSENKLKQQLKESAREVYRLERENKRLQNSNEDVDEPDEMYFTSLYDLFGFLEDNMEDWFVSEKAKKDLEEVDFFDTNRAYDYLVVLHKAWKQMKRGPLGMKLEDWLKQRGVDYASGISENTSKKQRVQYKVNYNGKEVECVGHVRQGRDQDPFYCLRVYVNLEEEKIIIGRIGHLDTKTTN